MVRSRTPLRLTGKPRCPSRKQKMGYRVPLDRSVQPPHPAAMPRLYTSFADFWPFYLREHSKASTRALHYVGTRLVVLIAVEAAAAGRGWWFAALPWAGHSFDWGAHFGAEKNRRAALADPEGGRE